MSRSSTISFRRYLVQKATKIWTSLKLQVLNPCRVCQKPVCNVERTRFNRVQSIWRDFPGSCFLLLMTQGFSHACPYWGQGYCLYEGKNPCFFFEKKRQPDPKYFRPWMKWRVKFLRFLDAITISAKNPERHAGNVASPPVFEKVKTGVYTCPFLVMSDPKRTPLSVLPSVRDGYREGYLLNRWEALSRKKKAGSTKERQAHLAGLIKQVEAKEAELNGLCGGVTREESVQTSSDSEAQVSPATSLR